MKRPTDAECGPDVSSAHPRTQSDDSLRYVVAVCVVIRRGDVFLAMRRSAEKDAGPGLWEAVSGRVESGEEPLDAAVREVAEETGLTVVVEPRPVTAYRATRLGEPMIVIVFRAVYQDGEVRPSSEHDDWAWLTPTEFVHRSELTSLVDAIRLAFAA